MGNTLYVFPDYYTPKSIAEIEQYGKENNYEVYRAGKYGKDKFSDFLNYYDEVIAGLKKVRNPEKYLEKCSNNIDNLSLSCYLDYEEIKYYCDITLKETFPDCIIYKGCTLSVYGLSQITRERKPQKEGSHVDWWLFKDINPANAFEEVLINNERNIL